MRKLSFFYMTCGVLFLTILLATVPVSAEDGRHFAGFYDLTNIVELGQDVQLTFSAEVFNYSDADLYGATITLEDSLLPSTIYASFSFIDAPDRQRVRLTKDYLTIPRGQYEHWQQGGTPRMIIEYVDQAGRPVHSMIEVARMPLGEVQ